MQTHTTMKPRTAEPLTIGPSIWSDDNKLRRVFSWLARIDVAPKFGTLPIHYYQQDMCEAIDKLKELATAKGVDMSQDHPIRFGNNIFSVGVGDDNVQFARLIIGKITPLN